jgi:hypothetical protein
VANALVALQSGAADVAMLSIPFNFKAEELGFRNLGSAVDYLQTPFAGVGAAEAKIKAQAHCPRPERLASRSILCE